MAVFFASIIVLLVGMTVWEVRAPTTVRRGFLPIATTRGDRLFIGLLAVAVTNLAYIAVRHRLAVWLNLSHQPSMWFGFAVSLLLLAFIARKG